MTTLRPPWQPANPAPLPSPEEQAIIDRFEAAPVLPEAFRCACGHDGLPVQWHADHCARPTAHGREVDPERVERVARAIFLSEDAAADWDRLRDALRIHHPIMRSETGPFSGCRCGAVRLGQDVIAHVVAELRAALDPS